MNALIKSIILGGLVLTGLALVPMHANATGFRHDTLGNNGKVLSKSKFYDAVENTKPDQVALVFGLPDQILTLKKPNGETQGVVWVYRNAVKQDSDKLSDARLVLIDGKLEYVPLSDVI